MKQGALIALLSVIGGFGVVLGFFNVWYWGEERGEGVSEVVETPAPTLMSSTINTSSRYDPVLEDDTLLADYTPLFAPALLAEGAMIYETFSSGQSVRLEVPLLPSPQILAVSQGEVQGLRILSNEYDIRVFHLIELDDSALFCDMFVSNVKIQDVHPFADPIQTIEVQSGKAKVFEFVTSSNKPVVGARRCIGDSSTKAWVMELFIARAIYEGKYEELHRNILESFDFTRD